MFGRLLLHITVHLSSIIIFRTANHYSRVELCKYAWAYFCAQLAIFRI